MSLLAVLRWNISGLRATVENPAVIHFGGAKRESERVSGVSELKWQAWRNNVETREATRKITCEQSPEFKFRFVFFRLQMLRFSALCGQIWQNF